MVLRKLFLLIHVVDKMLYLCQLNKLVQENFVVNMYHVNLVFIQLIFSLLAVLYQIVHMVLMLHRVCISLTNEENDDSPVGGLWDIIDEIFFLASDAKKCRAYGRGIQPKGVRTGDVAEFRVITKDAGEGAMKATVTGPGRIEIFLLDSFLYQ